MADEFTSLDYTASLHYDWRLYREDIAGSQAHARMLARQGIITADEAERMCTGLDAIRAEIEGGSFPWRKELEDLHMNVEARLYELIGERQPLETGFEVVFLVVHAHDRRQRDFAQSAGRVGGNPAPATIPDRTGRRRAVERNAATRRCFDVLAATSPGGLDR